MGEPELRMVCAICGKRIEKKHHRGPYCPECANSWFRQYMRQQPQKAVCPVCGNARNTRLPIGVCRACSAWAKNRHYVFDAPCGRTVVWAPRGRGKPCMGCNDADYWVCLSLAARLNWPGWDVSRNPLKSGQVSDARSSVRGAHIGSPAIVGTGTYSEERAGAER